MSLQITRVHPHGLARQTTVLSGHWCNICRQSITSESYRCSSCDYDICSSCLGKSRSTVATRVHVHPLTYTTTGLTSHYCDLCSLSCARDAWRCSTCNFDVCTSCFEGTQVVLPPKPVVPPTETKTVKHAHPLTSTTGAAAHFCDGCKRSVAGAACYRCDPCNFELCGDCYKASTEVLTRYHAHALTYTTSGLANHWCDVCRQPTTTEAWRCAADNFDLCTSCFERSKVPKPTPTPAPTPAVETKIHAHPLVRTTTGLSGKFCDGCSAKPLTVSYRCATDNYDLCTGCYDRTYKRVVSLHPHALTYTTENVSTHFCDICRSTIGSGAAFRCNGCDWDSCVACVERLTAPKPTPPTPTPPVVEDKEPIMTKAHGHALVRTTTGLSGKWCDGCRATNLTVSYRCEKDNFDLCPTCMNRNRSSQVTRLHAHPLVFTRGLVNHFCDDCRKSVSASWRCTTCNFDLCGVCFVRAKMVKPRPAAPTPAAAVTPTPTPASPAVPTSGDGIAVKTHAHVLTRNTGSLVGHYCDSCSASPLTEAYSCKECNFDNCVECLNTNRVQQSSRLHAHPMTWTTGLSAHYCDMCKKTTENAFRCASCNYDVCCQCFDTTRMVSPAPSAPPAAAVPVVVASPAAPPPTAPAPTTFWSCTACTYINVASANECYICGNGKS